MLDPLSTLAWLPRAPEDFSGRIRALKACDGVGTALAALAGHALGAAQLGRIASQMKATGAAGRDLAPLARFRLGLIASGTSDFIAPAIIGTGPRFGLAVEVVTAPFGQHRQTAMDPASAINRAGCDAVLVALDHLALRLETPPGDAAAAEAAVASALAEVEAIRAALRQNGVPTILVQTIPRPPEALLGSFDALCAGSARSQVDAFNRGLALALAGTPDRLLDIAGLAEAVGLANWHDPVIWNMAKQPFASAMLPIHADWVCRLVAAIRGKARKLLVIDLDNTTWGGIIGDDGMAGIRIAQGDATGEAYLAFQRMVLSLRARGVVIAVSSKNDDAIARQVFREHPDMLLREEHIAVFQANWNDKASNIRAICDTLSLGLDSVVFVDDNPAERALVRAELPQVAVPELPADPALVPRTVLAAGYFEAVNLSAEDRERADYYAANARRVELAAGGDIDDYLRTLDMRIGFAPFDAQGRARITQLINKTNQFNLTTRRYSEDEVCRMMEDPATFTLQTRVADIFGDNGMVSVVIAREAGTAWEIDSWLMSCRVLGRRVENAVLEEIVTAARARGISRLIGVYRPSARNGIVSGLYRDFGFTPLGEDADGATRWCLDLAAMPQIPAFHGQRDHA